MHSGQINKIEQSADFHFDIGQEKKIVPKIGKTFKKMGKFFFCSKSTEIIFFIM